MRDKLVGAILDGTKTSTTSMVMEYEVEDEAFPRTGTRQVVVDSFNRAVAVIETMDVQRVRLGAVPWEHARDEGEGYSSVSEWRVGHEHFWHSAEMRICLGCHIHGERWHSCGPGAVPSRYCALEVSVAMMQTDRTVKDSQPASKRRVYQWAG
ncbi:ASCH domain-containing protein [Aeromicrobium sp.]|uniref:ASCH domain-containing protein n=1 Tax=Aeromicrobium sp. TaxID=1871063 RepID=UPI0034589FFA